VLASYDKDQFTQELLTKLSLDSAAVPNYSLSQGLLRYKNRVWVGGDVELQQKLISACHSSALGGHSGVPVTYRRMK
jgi:hypothetical protein